MQTLLNLGSGPRSVLRTFADEAWSKDWRETRVDIDPTCKPDVIASLLDLGKVFPDDCADIIFCSHTLEHFHDHEIPSVLSEFKRIIRPDGAVVIKTPDLLQVAEILLRDDLEGTVYSAPAGDITILDVLYGHRPSIAEGDHYMAHHTGFTETSLAARLLDAGFEEVATEASHSVDFVAFAYNGARPYPYILERLRNKH